VNGYINLSGKTKVSSIRKCNLSREKDYYFFRRERKEKPPTSSSDGKNDYICPSSKKFKIWVI